MTDNDEVIPPLLLERRCDGGREYWTPEYILTQTAEWCQKFGEAFVLAHPYYPGCGKMFQWYYCGNCFCANCSYSICYEVKWKDFKSGKYKPK